MRSEFDFISSLSATNAKRKTPFSSVKIGIGDDCAVIAHNSETDLVVTTDLLVEDVDFRINWTRPEFIGHKALAVSLSDVAAMGGKPRWALCSIGIPEKIWKTDFVEKFYTGWFALAKKYGVELAGGDVSRTPEIIVIDSIVAGETKKNRAILRGGARVGDLIYVTGRLGGAAAGLRLLDQGFTYETEKGARRKLLCRQLAPNPQVETGARLAEMKLATAMLDLSDGLSSDLRHLCESSGVGARIEAAKIPLEKNLRKFLKENEDEISFALNGGEDFELLFTTRRNNKYKIEKEFKNKVAVIGEVTAEVGNIELVCENQIVQLKPKGFRHF